MARQQYRTMFDKFALVTTAYSLTDRQSDVLRALVRTGSLREAAKSLGVPYTSARNIVSKLKTKLGVATVPMMIGLVVDLVSEEIDETIGQLRRHDLFALSERQFVIARSISLAKSRQEIAASLKISEAVLDAELKEIYLIMGVRGAGELVGVVASIDREVAEDEGPCIDDGRQGHELPFSVVDNDGRSIGYSDFGPVDGSPVLILHSTITSRAPPTRLVSALRAKGFRPLAIDRPGFGDTYPGGSAADPYLLAAHDVAVVCAALGVKRLDVISRGSGQAAIRLAQIQPALINRVVLVSPTPAIAFTTIDRGPLGAVKRAFGKRPWAIEAMIRMLTAYATPNRLYDGMLRSFRESTPDMELVRNDPQFAADYLRAVRGFSLGRIAGYVAEQSAWGAGYDVEPMPGMTDWRIVQGRHFVLHDPVQAMTYWQSKLPDTPVKLIDEAGQMLAYSHPGLIVEALASRS
jgi:pimeloyl-ACP methyl ester carboxylesterase/DNA-binding CsgD family transcriptional regulator